MASLVFVCWGNICRSPMAERVARRMADERGLDIDVSSVALSDEEIGNGIDPRAVRVLRRRGYDADGHRARQVTADVVRDADLVVAAEPFHLDRLRRLAPDAKNLHLINDFNPALEPGTALIDPWYGDADGFHATLADIEAAMPAILDELERE